VEEMSVGRDLKKEKKEKVWRSEGAKLEGHDAEQTDELGAVSKRVSLRHVT
jgi:hypothetical protein